MPVLRFLAAVAMAVLVSVLPARAEIDVQELTSPSGHPFWLVQEMSIPIVAVEMEFQTGSWMDPEGKEGLSGLTMGLMDEGSDELDAVAFSNRRNDISARFGFGVGRDQATVSARFLVETLDESVDLLALAMTSPRFDPDAVERVRAQALAGVAQSKTQPNSVAGRLWFDRAYPGHPYGRTSRGTEESLTSITVDDLRAAHRRLIVRTGAHVVIVGALDAEGAGALVDRLLEGLPEGETGDVRPVETLPPPGLEVVEMNVPQSVALFGHSWIGLDDPDFWAATVANHILGSGSFSARLTEEVRVKRGLAYSVYSSVTTLDGASLVIGSVQTANERMADSLEVIRAEWARMASGDVSEAEVEAAKTYLTGSFALGFDTNSKIANYLVWMMGRGYDSGHVNRRNQLIEAVTAEDVRRASARLFREDDLSIVVVGKPQGLLQAD